MSVAHSLAQPQGNLAPSSSVKGKIPILGILPRIWHDPAQGLIKLYQDAGPVFWANLPNGRVCFAIGPEANEALFRTQADALTAEDDFAWLKGRPVGTLDGVAHDRIRPLMHVAVNGEPLARIGPLMSQIAVESVSCWQEVSALEAARLVAMKTVLRCGLGADIGELGHLEKVYAIFSRAFFAPKINLPFTTVGRGLRAREEIDNWLKKRIASYRSSLAGGRVASDDLIGSMVAASHREENPISDREIIENLRIMVVAGQETTASALAWLLIKLGTDDVLWARLCESIAPGTLPPATSGQAYRLTFPKAVVSEVLRRYTPAWFVPRKVITKDFCLLNRHVPKGTTVVASPLATHHLEAYWPDPFRFDETRWLDGRPADSDAYLPFGRGRHVCLGAVMAKLQLIQMLVALASGRRRPTLTRDYDLRPILLPFPHPPRKIRLRFET